RLRSSTRTPSSGLGTICRQNFLSARPAALPRLGGLTGAHRLGRSHDEARLFARFLLFVDQNRAELCAHERLEEGGALQIDAVAKPDRGRRDRSGNGALSTVQQKVGSIFE